MATQKAFRTYFTLRQIYAVRDKKKTNLVEKNSFILN